MDLSKNQSNDSFLVFTAKLETCLNGPYNTDTHWARNGSSLFAKDTGHVPVACNFEIHKEGYTSWQWTMVAVPQCVLYLEVFLKPGVWQNI